MPLISPRLRLQPPSSFLPTEFRGVSELGEIAGVGMLIALLTTITVLPAALTSPRPPPEPRQMGLSGSLLSTDPRWHTAFPYWL
jgi:hypothetical protein